MSFWIVCHVCGVDGGGFWPDVAVKIGMCVDVSIF